VRSTALALFAALASLFVATSGSASEPPQELRGVWITNVDSDVLSTKRKIAEAMDFLADSGFNIVFPVVWNKAVTLYPSPIMEREFGVLIDPVYGTRDPLAEILVEAHRRGMEVAPWYEYGFAAGNQYQTDYEPGSGGHILIAKPEWKALDSEGRIAEKNKFEWMNAFDPNVQRFMLDLMMESAHGYDIDGIQGDDRLPALPSIAGYDPYTVEQYRAEFGEDPPTDFKDPNWVQWRANRLSGFVAQWRAELKAIDPTLFLSSSPTPMQSKWGLFEYLQDSPTWVQHGLVDMVHPQAYRRDLAAYSGMIDDMVANQFGENPSAVLFPGILGKVGKYVIEPELLVQKIEYNREKGLKGEVLFFYEALTANDGANAKALAEGPYAVKPALLPHRNGANWRPAAIIANLDAATIEGTWEQFESERVTYARAKAGAEGATARWNFTVPTAGFYDIYVRLPWGEPGSTQLLVTVVDPSGEQSVAVPFGDPAPLDLIQAAVEEDPKTADNMGGWMAIWRVGVAEDGATISLTLAPAPGEERDTVIGPAMLLLNRKFSPTPAAAEPTAEAPAPVQQ